MNFYDKHMARQDDLKKIHEGAIRDTPIGGVDSNLMCVMEIIKNNDDMQPELFETAVLRRGYKIQHTVKTDMYELFRTTTTDYYKYVDDTIIDEFLEKGFVRAADEHQIARDRKRVEYLNKKIDKANSERNDSLMIHWRSRRKELIEKITRIEENFK
jgi:hypothetical protein